MKHLKFELSHADYQRSVEDYAHNWNTLDSTLYKLCSDHSVHRSYAAHVISDEVSY
jgi:hypothetical protein